MRKGKATAQASELILNSKAYKYCKASIKDKRCPKYVKKQMLAWMEIAEGKNAKYMISEKKFKIINGLLKVLIMPKGLKAGKTLYECSSNYQWLVYTAVFAQLREQIQQRENIRI